MAHAPDSERRTISLVAPADACRDAALCREWTQLAESSSNRYAFYQSAAWWRYVRESRLTDYVLRLHETTEPRLAVVQDGSGGLQGMVGIARQDCELTLKLRSRTLLGFRLPGIVVPGGEPLLRTDGDSHAATIRWLFSAFPGIDVIRLPHVPMDGECWRVLHEPDALRGLAFLHLPGRPAPHHLVSLGGSFDDYLARFNANSRYQIRRRIRQLREHCGGRLELVRTDDSASVSRFLGAAAAVAGNSRKLGALGREMDDSPAEIAAFADFADAGHLRCYHLLAGGIPCAFVRGFQFGGTFYYSRIGFDERYADYSPGNVILFLLIEDLFRERTPRRLEFQEGFWEYKRQFGTHAEPKQDLWIVRKNARFANLARFALARAYRSTLNATKRVLGRSPAPDLARVARGVRT